MNKSRKERSIENVLKTFGIQKKGLIVKIDVCTHGDFNNTFS